jgi:ATP-dependent Clp protease ATP-binding subunit ClpC
MGADMFERFTNRARRVVVLAQEEARLLRHNYIGTEHLLLGILAEGEGTAFRALDELGVTLEIARRQVEGIIGAGQNAQSGHIPFTPRAKKVLELSLREALKLGHNYIGTEHILLGILREGDGVGAQVLIRLGDDLSVVRTHVIRLAPGGKLEAGREPEGIAAEAMARMATTRTGVHELLQDISQRLANIEAHLGIARPPVPLTAGTGGAEPGAETAETGLAAGGETGADAAGDGPAAAKE